VVFLALNFTIYFISCFFLYRPLSYVSQLILIINKLKICDTQQLLFLHVILTLCFSQCCLRLVFCPPTFGIAKKGFPGKYSRQQSTCLLLNMADRSIFRCKSPKAYILLFWNVTPGWIAYFPASLLFLCVYLEKLSFPVAPLGCVPIFRLFRSFIADFFARQVAPWSILWFFLRYELFGYEISAQTVVFNLQLKLNMLIYLFLCLFFRISGPIQEYKILNQFLSIKTLIYMKNYEILWLYTSNFDPILFWWQ